MASDAGQAHRSAVHLTLSQDETFRKSEPTPRKKTWGSTSSIGSRFLGGVWMSSLTQRIHERQMRQLEGLGNAKSMTMATHETLSSYDKEEASALTTKNGHFRCIVVVSALEKRHANRNHPDVREQLAQWWRVAQTAVVADTPHSAGPDAWKRASGPPRRRNMWALLGGKTMGHAAYKLACMRVQKALMEAEEDWDEEEADALVEDAWMSDTHGRGDEISLAEFNDSLFELADMWTLTADGGEYAELLRRLRELCCDISGQPPRWLDIGSIGRLHWKGKAPPSERNARYLLQMTTKAAVLIQKRLRRRRQRDAFQQKRRAAATLQTQWRGTASSQRKLRRAAKTIQAFMRARAATAATAPPPPLKQFQASRRPNLNQPARYLLPRPYLPTADDSTDRWAQEARHPLKHLVADAWGGEMCAIPSTVNMQLIARCVREEMTSLSDGSYLIPRSIARSPSAIRNLTKACMLKSANPNVPAITSGGAAVHDSGWPDTNTTTWRPAPSRVQGPAPRRPAPPSPVSHTVSSPSVSRAHVAHHSPHSAQSCPYPRSPLTRPQTAIPPRGKSFQVVLPVPSLTTSYLTSTYSSSNMASGTPIALRPHSAQRYLGSYPIRRSRSTGRLLHGRKMMPGPRRPF